MDFSKLSVSPNTLLQGAPIQNCTQVTGGAEGVRNQSSWRKKRQIGQICTFQFSNLIFSSLTCRKEIIGRMLAMARIEGWKCHVSIDKTLKEKNISTYKVSFFPINIKRIPVCRALKDQPVLGIGSSGTVKILKMLKNILKY